MQRFAPIERPSCIHRRFRTAFGDAVGIVETTSRVNGTTLGDAGPHPSAPDHIRPP